MRDATDEGPPGFGDDDGRTAPHAEELFDGEIAYPPLPAGNGGRGRRRRSVRSPPRADEDLDVPYVHQLWDTPVGFNGHWACGPACAAMVLAHYGLLERRPLHLTRPTPHVNDYGWYVPSEFAYAGVTFAKTAATPDGTAAGIYGTVVDRIGAGWGAHFHSPDGRGLGPLFAAFLPAVGNTVRCVTGPKRGGTIFMERAAAEGVMKEAIDDGHPLIVSGRFGFRGRTYDHLIVVRGYHRDSATGSLHWVVNDPYGFETGGSEHDGERVGYTFDEINPKWMCVFRGPHRSARERSDPSHIPVRLFDPVTNQQIGEGTLIEGTDKVYVKQDGG
jgi:hypothetical protein